MQNPLKSLIEAGELPPYKVADKAGVTRGTIYNLIKEDNLPGGTMLDTLSKIAAVLGYRVKVSFEPIND